MKSKPVDEMEEIFSGFVPYASQPSIDNERIVIGKDISRESVQAKSLISANMSDEYSNN